MRKTLEERFFEKVNKTEHCWEWIAGIGMDGYGTFWMDGKTRKAHRASWKIHKGEIPRGILVCHSCDNTICVRPSHLFLGSPADNSKDMVLKKRSLLPEQTARNKLTWNQVKEIRGKYKKGIYGYERLAKYFCVTKRLIRLIVEEKIWNNKERYE